MSISVEAAEARDSLSDDKEIVNTYEVKADLVRFLSRSHILDLCFYTLVILIFGC